MAVLASVVVAAPPELDDMDDGMAEPDDDAIELGAIDDDAMELGAIELAAIELGAIELGAIEDAIELDEGAAAGALLLEAVELLEALELLLDPQAAATKAMTATPAMRPVRATALLLVEPGVVDTRTSSS